MSDVKYGHFLLSVINIVNDSIVSRADSPAGPIDQFFTTYRSRILAQSKNRDVDSCEIRV